MDSGGLRWIQMDLHGFRWIYMDLRLQNLTKTKSTKATAVPGVLDVRTAVPGSLYVHTAVRGSLYVHTAGRDTELRYATPNVFSQCGFTGG